MAVVLDNTYCFWDADELLWTSNKIGNTSDYPGFYAHMTIERATTNATTIFLKVWAWHTMNVGDLSGTGNVMVKVQQVSVGFSVAVSGNYSASIGLEPTLLFQAQVDGIDPAEFVALAPTVKFNNKTLAQDYGIYCVLSGYTFDTATVTEISRTETDTAWVFNATYTSSANSPAIVLVAESANKSVEVGELIPTALTPAIHSVTIPKTQLKEVLKASVGIFGNPRALLVQEWERVVPPLFHVSNQYERSIGIGCHAAEQPNTVKFAPDMEVIGIGGYSTTPVRMGKYLDTPYSVYKVVVPFPGKSLSKSFTAPAQIREIVSVCGAGQTDNNYWFPIPHASTSAYSHMSSFRCTITGNSCLVEVGKGSSVKYVNDTVKAIVEFVC